MKNFLLITTLLFSTNVFSQIPTTGLVAFYPFCGNTRDVGPHGYDMRDSGAVLCPDRFGTPNAAYQFNGVSNLIYRDTSLPVSSDYTYTCWMLADTIQDGIVFYNGNSNTNGVGIVFDAGSATPGNKVTMLAGNVCFCIAVPASYHQWHNVVLKRNGTNIKLYIDTVLVGNTSSTPLTACCLLSVGMDYSDGTNPFKGKIDDIALYNRALSDTEIKQIYKTSCSVNGGGVVTTHPSSVSDTIGKTVTFTMTTSGYLPSYQWQKKAPSGGWVDLTNTPPYGGVYTNTLKITGITAALNSYQYRCVVASILCCMDSTNPATLTVVGTNVENVFGSNEVVVYPNPAHAIVNIEAANPGLIDNSMIQVSNIVGQMVYDNMMHKGRNEVKLNIPGVYFIKIIDNQNNTLGVKKIIVE